MKLSRPSRYFAALLAVVSVLFSQLAVAAYACPGFLGTPAMEIAVVMLDHADQHVMPDCDEMDSAQPALCHAHMQAGDQSLDKPLSPNVPPAVAVLLAPAISNLRIVPPPVLFYADAAWLRRSSEPPLSIQNCCFRI